TPPLTPPSSPPSTPSSSDESSFLSSSCLGWMIGLTWVGLTILCSTGVTFFVSECDFLGGGGGGGGGGGAEKKVSETAGGAISSTWKNDQMMRTIAAMPCSATDAMMTARRRQLGLVSAT